jgi:hypothetical protein
MRTATQMRRAIRFAIPGPELGQCEHHRQYPLLRSVTFSESKQLQLRFKAFNVFNHAQFTNPDGNISPGIPNLVGGVNRLGTFGLVSNMQPGSILQVAAKFAF